MGSPGDDGEQSHSECYKQGEKIGDLLSASDTAHSPAGAE